MDIFDVPIFPEAVGVHWIPFKILNYTRKRLSDSLIGTTTFGISFLQERTDLDDNFFDAVERGMQCIARSIFPFCHPRNGTEVSRLIPRFLQSRLESAMSEDPELGDFLDYMDKLKNYERSGVPRGAGTDSDDGFDLGRMQRLLQRLGNPHTQFKVCNIFWERMHF